MTGGLVKHVGAGRHTRRSGLAGLRRLSLTALIMLVVQYGLGMVLNLYVAVPASDQRAGIMQQIASGPLTLTLHVLLGLALIGTAIALLVRAVGVGNRLIAVPAAAGLTAIGGAFASGEIFVRNGQNGASLAMALLTGVALLCYFGVLARASAAYRQVARRPPRPAIPAQADADVGYPAPTWPAAPGGEVPTGEGTSW